MTNLIAQSVDVNVTAASATTRVKGFVPLLLNTTEVAGVNDAANPTRSYATLAEVGEDFDAGSSTYQAASAMLAQNPGPDRIVIGFVAADATAPQVTERLELFLQQEPDTYFICSPSLGRPTNSLSPVRNFAAANQLFAVQGISARGTLDGLASSGNFSRHTLLVYHTNTSVFASAAVTGILAGVDFDDPDSAFTLKFKSAEGVPALTLDSADLAEIIGQHPGQPQDTAVGACANTFIPNRGGSPIIVPGSMFTPNVFADSVMSQAWLKARLEEDVASTFLQGRIPYDDTGLEIVAGAVRARMERAILSGIVARDELGDDGTLTAGYDVKVPSFSTVSAAQRQARIAPTMTVTYREAGALHFVTINVNVTF